jgi:site-specific DNA-methyltransferase (adenine-specific)
MPSPSTRVVDGSCTEAPRLCPELIESVTLAVTSPPYHNAISYVSHADNPSENYRERSGISYSEEYLPLMDQAWRSMHTLLRPGGYLAINVGTVLEGGRHFPLPMDILRQLTTVAGEWEFMRNIIWNKVTAGVKRAGSVIQHKLPGYWYPNIMTEHIIVVRKPGPLLPRNYDVPTEWWQDVWDLAPVPPRTIAHPAPFPEDLPHRLIRMLTQRNDVVVDPFNGAGATTKAAHDLSRVGVGFEIESRYADIARERLGADSSVRDAQLTIKPQPASIYTPKKMRGQTRHGSGLRSRRTR